MPQKPSCILLINKIKYATRKKHKLSKLISTTGAQSQLHDVMKPDRENELRVRTAHNAINCQAGNHGPGVKISLLPLKRHIAYTTACAEYAYAECLDDRKLKILFFGKMDDKNKRGRPHREWTDDIVEWCGEYLQELSHLALDRSNWQKMVKQASDINGH